MKHIWILMAIFASPHLVKAKDHDVEESPQDTALVEQAKQKAENYLWEQIDPVTGFWPRRQVSSALLGVLPELVTLKGGLHANFGKQNETQIVYRNMDRLALDFFTALNRNGNLEAISDDVLSAIVAVMRMSCVQNPEDYFGFDLIEELNRRVDTIFNANDWSNSKEDPPLHFPAMMLDLCNNHNYDLIKDHGVSVLELMSLRNYQHGQAYPLGVERAALNALALRCLQNHFTSSSDIKRKLFNYAIRNLKYIYSMQEEDGGYATVYTTALAIAADLSRLASPPNSQPFKFAKARQWLVKAQKSDGSFGSSITFTSIAIAGLTSRSIDTLAKIDCNHQWSKSNDEFEAEVEITDNVYSHQTFITRLPVKKGDRWFSVLNKFAKENPKTLALKQSNSGAGIMITCLNRLCNFDALGLSWKAYRGKNQEKSGEIFDLSKEVVDEDHSLVLEYS